MKKTSLLSMLILALALSTLAACGGGGGSDSVTIPQPTTPQPTTAVLTLSTAGTGTIPADTIITGYDVTISLPAGVTVKSTTPPQTDAGVVTDYPAGSLPPTAVYSAATGSIPGKVRIVIVSGTGGYGAGVFSKVNCDIAAGHYPNASDFQQPTFAAFGWDNNTNSNVDLTGYLSLTEAAVIQ